MQSKKSTKAIIEKLAPWFHNIHLPGGESTAPHHPLGDFPSFKWEVISPHLPEDMTGMQILDIGCNAGFYSVQCALRGAVVTAIDMDTHYLRQAKWIADVFNVNQQVHFHQMQVYDLAKKNWQFDIVLFLGVFYHLRYPLLAMDIISEKVKQMLVFQSLMFQENAEYPEPDDFSFDKRDIMLQNGWPLMAFIEKKFMGDPTNWWVPNSAAIKAMLRTTGFRFLNTPGQEIYFFAPDESLNSVTKGWNRSELLSANGKSWKMAAKSKTQFK